MTHKKKTSKKKTGAKKVTAATPTTGESEASSPALPMFRRLRLEAIFHPKFENEMQEQLIRQQMKERVANEKGYLEVSVKHSGSLLLWSGGERFYSKNSTDNIFTAAGQILLRQHYGRLDANSLFQECSEYIKKQRLTLSFEVVTSFLGDHGDRPQRDFLILTAAAYREKEQFLSTTELIELAQQFQLPHNDAWVFTTVDSCQALFDLYDASRETGVASNLVPALTSAADTHVSSMYPHTTFQGNVMEGIVIRFVPCRETASLQQAVERVQVAAAKSVERLQKTLDLPACPERYKDQSDASPVLKVDLRSLYQETRVVKAGDEEGFDYKVQELLHKSGSERKVERLSRALSSDIPVLAKKLSMASDPETRRIAKLIQSLGELNDRVQYSLVQESNTGRWLCTIHVYFDKTFQKYRKRKDKADMELFRGFVFELLEDENSKDEMTRAHKEEPPQQSYADPEEPLMLKMKLLPYMVRTFGCRNGLVRVKQGGPADFSRYTRGLLSKWNMSNEAKAQWQPFFDAWGRYAHACLEGKQSASMFSDTPLTSTNYLDHLIPFQESFESGSLSSEFSNSNNGSFKFSGVLVVVAATSETASSVADFVAEKMGGAKRVHGLKQLNSHFMELCCGSGNGQVVSAAVEEGSGKVRGLSKEYGDDITVLLFQFTDKDVAAADSKRIRGIAESWKKVKCRNVVSLPYDSLFQKGGQLEASDTFLSFVSNEAGREHPEEMPGLLVWFPGIPGCGKSCMVETEKQVRTRLKDMKGPARNLVVLSGDKTKGKYWPLVKQKRRRDTTSILLADKNAPSVSWDIVAGACAATKAVGVPVLPDGAALSTTEIAGTRHLDGRTSEKKHVYPFSLAYLAVCLARVMARSEGSHAGKLDKGTHRACMIVVMFYSLYRRVTADEFLGTMEYKFGSEGAMLATSPITLPFFKSPSPELPVELQEALVEALKWQAS